jgi:hypothetical protein
MQTALETSASARYAALVTLSWSKAPVLSGATEEIKRYTNWDSDIVIGDDTFESVPEMDVELGEVHGGTEDKPGKITCSKLVSPFNSLRTGLVFPRVDILVEQVDPSDTAATRRQLFVGNLGKVTGNPAGRSALVRAQLNGIKAQMDKVRLGVPATNSCQWIFGDPITCGYDKEATKQAGSVLSVGSPNRNSIELSVGNGTSPNERFRRGTIHVYGMKLTIRQSFDDGTFDLWHTPPAWLVGKPVSLYEGCDKQYSTCTVFGRESRFMGYGIRIPSRNPLFETD